MRFHKKVVIVLAISLPLYMLIVIKGQIQRKTAETVDVNHFPLLDYANRKPINPSEEPKRLIKNKKYNNKHSQPIGELSEQIYVINEWDVGLPALPVSRSAAVIVGKVSHSEAFLSEDLTNIYSEFTISVDEVIKNDKKAPIKPGDSITTQRLGGRVKLFSGKVVVSQVNHQDLPREGRSYILFLTHEFPIGGALDDDLFILTGYEMRDNQILPLDKTVPGHPISRYKDKSKDDFMNDLLSAIAANP